jgi:hypothetical protein
LRRHAPLCGAGQYQGLTLPSQNRTTSRTTDRKWQGQERSLARWAEIPPRFGALLGKRRLREKAFLRQSQVNESNVREIRAAASQPGIFLEHLSSYYVAAV